MCFGVRVGIDRAPGPFELAEQVLGLCQVVSEPVGQRVLPGTGRAKGAVVEVYRQELFKGRRFPAGDDERVPSSFANLFT